MDYKNITVAGSGVLEVKLPTKPLSKDFMSLFTISMMKHWNLRRKESRN
ncbi:hypothetical protein J2S17_003319 [Cytobacillus purgationiresistens]|uniref:Uncharacterized protein n=1 Tax=Cytobacillus purgationiresistens TaxID=863449 RepID=A0ABU0AL24_9BACI|nr:hypothetical protein [Cytobacillus purgationiresistens]